MKWFRLYSELVDDPKQASMSDRTFRHFILLLCLANDSEKPGTISMKTKDIAWRLRVSEKNLQNSINELCSLMILSENDEGAVGLRFINWAKRNFRSDDVNQRVKRFRKKTTSGNETLHETLRILESNVLDTETETDTDTETETETEENPPTPPSGGNGDSPPITPPKPKKKESGLRPVSPDAFQRFWDEYPRKEDKQNAIKAWNSLTPDDSLAEAIMNGLRTHKACNEQWQRDGKKYIPYACRFLSKRRWEDEFSSETVVQQISEAGQAAISGWDQIRKEEGRV